MSDAVEHPLASARKKRIVDALAVAGVVGAKILEQSRPDSFVIQYPNDEDRKGIELDWRVRDAMNAAGFEWRWAQEPEGHSASLLHDRIMPEAYASCIAWAQGIESAKEKRLADLWSGDAPGMRMIRRRRSSVLCTRTPLMREIRQILTRARCFADIDAALQWRIDGAIRWIERVGVISREKGFGDVNIAIGVQDDERIQLRRLYALRRLAVRHLAHI
jgi:hypothetical protein